MHLLGEVIVERPDGGDFTGPGCGVQTVFRIAAVLILDAVAAEIGHVAVNVRQRDGAHKLQIHVHNTDLIQRLVPQPRIAGLFDVAEEIPQVEIVFVDGASGMGFDGFMIRQEIPQDLRRFGTIVDHRLMRAKERITGSQAAV